MVYVQVVPFIAGGLTLVVGYRKNLRNVLLGAAIVLFPSGAIARFSQGFIEGFHDGCSWTRTVGPAQ